MTEENDTKTRQKIHKLYGRIVIIAGTLMGLAMSIYFFTYGMLIDQGNNVLLWLEGITTILFVFGLIYLKRVSFFITRILLSWNADCRRLLKGMTVTDIEKVPQ
jgi:hypothetical protein